MQILLNFVAFQCAWFACVIGASANLPWLGVLVTFIILSWHLYQAHEAQQELCLMLVAVIVGGLFDQCLLSNQLIQYHHDGWFFLHMKQQLVPVWILALWLGFASTLNISLRWMRQRYFIAALFGAIGGPLAYIGAEKLGAVTIAGINTYVALSIGWAVITPLMMRISLQLDGFLDNGSSSQLKPQNIKAL